MPAIATGVPAGVGSGAFLSPEMAYVGSLTLPETPASSSGRADRGRSEGQPPNQAPQGPSASQPDVANQNSALHQRLVQQVKVIQRSSDALKAVWHRWCDEEKGGIRDPSRHDIEFLQRFLSKPEAAEALATFVTVPQESQAIQLFKDSDETPAKQDFASKDPLLVSLVNQVKRAQRGGYKDAWKHHCESEAQGMRDPIRHSLSSLRRFLSSIELSAVQPDTSTLTGCQAASSSRNGLANGAAQVERKATNSFLIEKVKCVQRTSPELKDLWRKMCDQEALGAYDPVRHDNSFLARFLAENGIPIDEQNLSDHSGPHTPGLLPLRQSVQSDSFISSNVNAALIQRVKMAQRSSEELRKAWQLMCDAESNGIRDPARHDASFLLRFLEGSVVGTG